MRRFTAFFAGLASTVIAVGGGKRTISRHLYNKVLGVVHKPEILAYPGRLEIAKQAGLTDEERLIEARFAALLESRRSFYIGEYKSRWRNVLNTDNARELSDEYNHSRETRAKYSRAVHEPASSLIKYIWRKLLRKRVSKDRNTVVFMAGGGGSGKTAAVEELPDVKEIWDLAHIVYDTTMAQEESSIHKIDQALANRKEVVICYVHRPLDKAARGMINRAVNNGRTVPVDVLAIDHFNAQRTYLALFERYEKYEDVEFLLINNSGGLYDIELINVDIAGFLRDNLYVDLFEMKAEVRSILENEYWTRKGSFEEVPDFVYRSILGEDPQAEG